MNIVVHVYKIKLMALLILLICQIPYRFSY